MDPVPTPDWVSIVLDREPRPRFPSAQQVVDVGRVWLVTGGLGSIGAALGSVLDAYGVEYLLADVDEMDVTDEHCVRGVLADVKPDVIVHLAGAKHAPEGETDPMHAVEVNAIGTRNVLRHAGNARVVTASTCKACDPETAYGSSKLIAERLTMNAGQRVARFHNVVESSGNVFRIWDALTDDSPLMVSDGERYFISRTEALGLLMHAAVTPKPGRYCVDPGKRHRMTDIAERLYPGRRTIRVTRRGDRTSEPLHASNEIAIGLDGILQIRNSHDPARSELIEVAA